MVSTPSPGLPSAALVRHLSAARLSTYLAACGGDLDDAIALYAWNGEIAGAFWEHLGHLEVALRNTLDARLAARRHRVARPGSWPDDPARELTPAPAPTSPPPAPGCAPRARPPHTTRRSCSSPSRLAALPRLGQAAVAVARQRSHVVLAIGGLYAKDAVETVNPRSAVLRAVLRHDLCMSPVTELSKGANAPVTPTRVRVTTRWAAVSGAPDVDTSALLLAVSGKVRSDDDFVFYNQPTHPSGTVRHAGQSTAAGITSDALEVDLHALPPEVERVILGASAEGGVFAQVTNLSVALADEAGQELLRFAVTDAGEESALVLGELYRRGGQWKLRAVGQGYASGLAGLATDFGISVDDSPQVASPAPEPLTAPAPPASSPAAGGAAATAGRPSTAPAPAAGQIRLTKGEERLPIDMRKRLSLRKQQVAVSLLKRGAPGASARVILVLDASGSMTSLYNRGVVARVVERMAAVAAQLDDDGQMQAWTFATNPARLPDLTIADLPQWLALHVRVGEFRLVSRPKTLQPGQVDMRAVGGRNEEEKVIAEVRRYVAAEPSQAPTLVLFFSDGGVYRSKEIERELRAAVPEPIFWQFVGLGRARFGVLERLDTLTGRLVDNVGFFAVADIEQISDADLYDRLLSEFPSWLKAATAAGVLTR